MLSRKFYRISKKPSFDLIMRWSCDALWSWRKQCFLLAYLKQQINIYMTLSKASKYRNHSQWYCYRQPSRLPFSLYDPSLTSGHTLRVSYQSIFVFKNFMCAALFTVITKYEMGDMGIIISQKWSTYYNFPLKKWTKCHLSPALLTWLNDYSFA